MFAASLSNNTPPALACAHTAWGLLLKRSFSFGRPEVEPKLCIFILLPSATVIANSWDLL